MDSRAIEKIFCRGAKFTPLFIFNFCCDLEEGQSFVFNELTTFQFASVLRVGDVYSGGSKLEAGVTGKQSGQDGEH